MSVYICDNCDVIENTALGLYHFKDHESVLEEYRGKALCSQCAPNQIFVDGSTYHKYGKWHGRFERKIVTEQYIRENAKDFIYLGRFEYLRKSCSKCYLKYVIKGELQPCAFLYKYTQETCPLYKHEKVIK